MFLCLVLTHKVSPTHNSESTAVQVLSCGQAQPTTRGEAALDCDFELDKENKTLQMRVSHQKSKALLPYQKSCTMKNQYTSRQQILGIYCQRLAFKTTPKPHTA